MRFCAATLAVCAAMGGVFVYGACAGGEDPSAAAPLPEADAGPSQLGPVDAASDADARVPKDAGDAAATLFCSDAGWCETRFPDDSLAFVSDLWPVDGKAFAARNGIEQWDGTSWISLYDESSFHSIWAPNENEVWAGGDQTSDVVHGKRSGSTWTWSTEHLGEIGYSAVVSIWGSSADDVYAATPNKLYHRIASTDGGGPTWAVEFEDEQPPSAAGSDFAISQVLGTGPTDVWVLASRITRCSILAHKEQTQFTRVSDCKTVCNPDTGCFGVASPPALLMPWGLTRGGFALASGTVLGISPADFSNPASILQKVSLSSAGDASVTVFPAPGAGGISVWGLSETDLYSAGYGLVTHSSDALTDGGKFSISTVALNGAPIVEQLSIRGDGAKNVWVFGGSYALHKL